LRQFDDDSRIELAFLLLKRLAEQGFVSEGARACAMVKLQEMIQSRRLEIGNGQWQVVRGRRENLCVTYLDSDLKSGADTAREVQKMMRPAKCGPTKDVIAWMRTHLEEDGMVVVVDDFSGTGHTLGQGLASFRKQLDTRVWDA
jgi:hypothetical protein